MEETISEEELNYDAIKEGVYTKDERKKLNRFTDDVIKNLNKHTKAISRAGRIARSMEHLEKAAEIFDSVFDKARHLKNEIHAELLSYPHHRNKIEDFLYRVDIINLEFEIAFEKYKNYEYELLINKASTK